MEKFSTKLKKALVILLAMALATGAVQGKTAAAKKDAKPLTLADFKFTGKYKDQMNKCATKKKYSKLSDEEVSYAAYVDITGEKSPKKCIKTKRGITLLSTKSKVFKKYGKTSVFKALEAKDHCDAAGAGEETYKLIKNDKMCSYTFSDKKTGNFYGMMFYFDNKDRVEAIIIYRNMF